MKKRILGGLAALAAGIGIAQLVRSQRNNNQSQAGKNWTTDDMPDLTGKVIIVTGANSGTGFETAKEVARKGAQTILACRSLERAQDARNEILAEIPDAPVEIMELDLASLASVREFAVDFKAKYDRLDVLVNNAGIMMVPYGTTEDGFERQFGVNHLGHFALTGLLLDLILVTPGARVVNVSSNAHRRGSMDFDNLMFENGQGYSSIEAYGRSKLANLLFTYELQRRFDKMNINALAIAAHPGSTRTNITRHLEDRWYVKLLGPLWLPMLQSADMGALPILRAAVDPNAAGGDYYGPGGFSERRGYPVLVESSAASHNEADARRLWQVSQQLTGVRYEQLDKTASREAA